jgi:hypothetical protein
MLDLNGLRAARQAGWNLLESELVRLHALTELIQTTGTEPPHWEIQHVVVRRAQAVYDDADTAYMEALHQPPFSTP